MGLISGFAFWVVSFIQIKKKTVQQPETDVLMFGCALSKHGITFSKDNISGSA